MDQIAYRETPSVFGVPTLNGDGVMKLHDQRKLVSVQVSPLNFTHMDLTVGYRNGLVFRIPKQYDPDHQALILRTEIFLPSLIEINAHHLLSVVDEHCSSEMRLVKAALSPNRDDNGPYRDTHFGGTTLIIDHEISIQEVRQYGGSVYFHDVDLLISTLPQAQAPLHPYSEQGMLRTACVDVHRSNLGRFGFSIEIVDNQGRIGDRYMNIGGHVTHIPAGVNPRKLDGIYIGWNQGVTGRLDVPETIFKCYDPEVADQEFKLFRSYSEAERFGNGDEARREELAKLEHSTALLRAELQAEKAKADRKALEMEQAMSTLKHENEMLTRSRDEVLSRRNHDMEIERQKVKDHYESRSYQRKDDSEVVKVLPAIVVGVGAVIMAIKAFF
jgi:hypothetical protein